MRAMAWAVAGAAVVMVACGGETNETGSSGGGAGTAASGATGATGGSGSGGAGATGGLIGGGGAPGGTGGAGTGGTAATAGSGATGATGATGGSGATGPCPDPEPTPGDTCTPGAAMCIYPCQQCWCATGTWECKPKPCTTPCSQPGAWCDAPGTQCSCWNGDWSCEATSDAAPPLDPATLPKLVTDGDACSSTELVCHPKGSNGAACQCVSGKWSCAPPLPDNQGCPTSFDAGAACGQDGMLCTKTGWCPPTCLCTLDGSWDCVTFTPC